MYWRGYMEQIKKLWVDEIIDVLKELGGKAALVDIRKKCRSGGWILRHHLFLGSSNVIAASVIGFVVHNKIAFILSKGAVEQESGDLDPYIQ
ncbi:hypothetical protein V7068_22120 [Bacillus sp. JJ634]